MKDGQVADIRARAVIDASGTWGHSNPLGVAGLPAAGETEAAAWLVGPLPDVLGADRKRFAGKHTLVVGMDHSAANTLLALVQLREEEPGAVEGLGGRERSAGGCLGRVDERGGAFDEGPFAFLPRERVSEAAA